MSKMQWGGVALAALLLCLFLVKLDGTVFSTTLVPVGIYAVASAPMGYDPLTEQERATVAQAAIGSAVSAAAAGEPATPPELLLVERHDAGKAAAAKGNWPRQGDVYLYDYASDTLIRSIVDVQSGAVITVERVQGVQLPLTAPEEQRALTLVADDPALWADLTARYQRVTGEALTAITQLQVKVSVFHADVMPTGLNAAAQRCGQHRCAQVLLFTVDKTLLDLTPLVDLSQGQVVQVLDTTLE